MENKSLAETRAEEKDAVLSATITDTWEEPALFKNKKKSKQRQKQAKHNAFDIDFEESKQTSTPNDISDTSIADSTKIGKFDPFLNKKQSKYNAFDINFEDSKQIFTPEDTNEENLSKIRKSNPFQHKIQTKHNAFDIDFEESKQISTPNDTTDASEQDLSKIKKRKIPFQNKKQGKHNAFDIDFEESKQTLTPNDTSDTTTGNSTRIGKIDPFLNKKQNKYNAFDINFEDSKQIFTPEDTSEENLSQVRKSNPFENKIKSKHNAFDIDFEESKQISTPNDTTDTSEQNLTKIRKRKIPFQNKEQTKHNAFDIDCEESTTGTVTTPSLKNITPFRPSKKSGVNGEDFDVNFDKSNITSDLSSLRAAENENSFKAKSNDINESIQIPRDKPSDENNSGLDVSSFNDENLNNWISDHSDDETNYKEILDESLGEKSFPVSPPLKDNEATLISDEDLEKQFELKFNAIIDEAKRGKVENSTVAVPEAEKPGKPNIKRCRDKENKPRLAKPAPFVNKRLYNHLTKKIKPKYGIDSVIKAEEIIKSICEAVKIVTRRKNYQKKIVNDLKVEMAKHGIIETTNDFYIFVRNFLSDDFREKVIPCLQPGTNIVFPPKDSKNPFEKILNN